MHHSHPKAVEKTPSRSSGTWFSDVFGPGIVLALVTIGPGDFVSNSVAGARHGLGALWLVALGMAFRFVWLNAAAKYVLLTGESLLTGLRRCGPWVGWVTFVSLLVEGHVRNLFKYLLMGSCLHLVAPLPTMHSPLIWSLFSVGTGFVLMFFRGYKAVESVFKVLMAIMILALVVAAARGGLGQGSVLESVTPFVIPGSGGTESFIILAALIGTSVGSVTNLVYCYFLEEKGWRGVSWLRRQRVDLAFSMGLAFLVALLLQTVAAGSLAGADMKLASPAELVDMFTGALGTTGRFIYGFGLWAAAYTGYVGITAGFGLVATDIWRNHLWVVEKRENTDSRSETDPAYRFFVAFWCLSPVYVFFTDWKPLWVVLAVNAAVLLLQPALTLALLIITAKKRYLGRFRNSLFTNLMLTALLFFCGFVAWQALMLD